MSTPLSSAGFALAVLFCISCNGPAKSRASLDISVRNDTTTVLDEVKLLYGSNLASVSDPILSPSNFMTLLGGCERPSTDTAEVSFVEHQSRQPHTVKVNMAPLKALPGGKHQVVINITALDQARIEVDGPPCHYNLLVIESAKQMWAWGKSSKAEPSWADLRAYFPQDWANGMPSCPVGGTYSIGGIGEPAKCSAGGKGHSLQ
ncbi:MAG TPA: hypothetical protein VFZ59_01145 [Verrucomicrobiae bacterium]|nr:hypothetical protein [Verrucomicrobiae bacterium]